MLLLHNFKNLHGASLHANAAGDTLGSRTILGSDHDLHGAGFHALAAGGAELLVDHVNAGLGILGNRTSLTNLSALATLNTDHGLCLALLFHDLDAGQVLMELLVESSGTCINTLQTGHTLSALLNCKLLHNKESPLLKVRLYYTRSFPK